MKIAVDETPLADESSIAHRIRGIGFYIKNLKKSLLEFFPENKYIFFNRGQSIPNDIDIVHYPYFEPFFLTLPFHKRHRTVVTVHDLTPLVFPKYFPAGIRGNLKWQLQKIALMRSDSIITDSECSKRDIVRYTNISYNRVHRVYLAAGDEFEVLKKGSWEAELKRKYNLPAQFVLYVGDVTWNKNIPRLITAIKKINVPLVMVGKALVEKDFDKNNSWNQDLLKIQQLTEKDNRIIKLGFVPTKDLISIYNLTTVFAMPSLYEGFGLPILEAMSCGCPVVTTKEGSIPETAEDSAFYVNAYDTSDIGKGIKEVFLNNSLRDKLSSQGLQQAKKFSWRMTAKKTMQVYKEVYEKNH